MIKAAAASPSPLRHTGPAVVFHSYEEMRARVDDPLLDVSADSVLAVAGCGPVEGLRSGSISARYSGR